MLQSPCKSWHRILSSWKGSTSVFSASTWVWMLTTIQAERCLPYGYYWLEREPRVLNTSHKWMVSNFCLRITMALKWTQCQVFIRMFYSGKQSVASRSPLTFTVINRKIAINLFSEVWVTIICYEQQSTSPAHRQRAILSTAVLSHRTIDSLDWETP